MGPSPPHLSQRAHDHPFPQSSPIPVSPPASVNSGDSPQPGFGWEFELALQNQMDAKIHVKYARFQRYERFGMTWEDAGFPTPKKFRNDYDELVRDIANDRTPSPSPEATVSIAQKVDTIKKYTRTTPARRKGFYHPIPIGQEYTANDSSAVNNTLNHDIENRITKQTRAKRAFKGKNSDNQHSMRTRSKTAALQSRQN
ncbi:hypothetical protein BGZ60DRAFT_526409 [Tricladium varicosporioides]|nr:hypothetical protein BGZ60DRAFT_526409 [Hymenoscyphus varicosporioides]